MTQTTMYTYLGTNGTICSPVHLEDVYYIRIDTDFPNKRMQHIFIKNGFKECGVINFKGPKKAYDKILEKKQQ